MPEWPSELPVSPLVAGFAEAAPDTRVVTEMDQGPAKMRRRGTAGVRGLSFRLLLDGAGVQALDDFFETALEGGTRAFDFTHPRTGGGVSCRFVEPPAYTAAGGTHYHAAIRLEVLP